MDHNSKRIKLVILPNNNRLYRHVSVSGATDLPAPLLLLLQLGMLRPGAARRWRGLVQIELLLAVVLDVPVLVVLVLVVVVVLLLLLLLEFARNVWRGAEAGEAGPGHIVL